MAHSVKCFEIGTKKGLQNLQPFKQKRAAVIMPAALIFILDLDRESPNQDRRLYGGGRYSGRCSGNSYC
jgi:hypothetical protein